MQLIMKDLHFMVIKVIFESHLFPVLLHYNDLMLGKMQVPVESSDLNLEEYGHGKDKHELDSIPEGHGLFPDMELVLMCLLLLVELKQILPQLVQQLVRLVQLVRVIQQLVG